MNMTQPSTASVWIVRPGDSLSGIAGARGITLSALLAANPACRADPDLIRVGQSIALPPLPAAQASLAPDPAQQPEPEPVVTERAVQLILACEVTSEAAYDLRCQAPSWPAGQSGVTIGIGYDLGYVSAAQFRADWAAVLPEATLARLAAVCGLNGPAARQPAVNLSDIKVPWTAATAMFRNRTLPETAAQTRAALSNSAALPGDSFGALVSLVYNRGACFAASGDRYREMRAIHDAMAQRDFAAIPVEIRAMKRLWQGIPNLVGLIDRREREALLFEAGLADAGVGEGK